MSRRRRNKRKQHKHKFYRAKAMADGEVEFKQQRPDSELGGDCSEESPGLCHRLFDLCQDVLGSPRVRAAAYLAASVLLSLLGPWLGPSWQDAIYTARKTNLFNRYFVKLGWAWTLAAGVPLAVGAAAALGGTAATAKAGVRAAVATAVWFSVTNGFVVLLKSGVVPGLDISGHCFMLIWCQLYLVEESKALRGVRPLPGRLLGPGLVFLTLLVVLWDAMLASTMLFYHTLAEKVLASALAVACWAATYNLVYPALGLQVRAAPHHDKP